MKHREHLFNGYQVITDMNMTTTKLCLKSRLNKVRAFKKRPKLRVATYKTVPSTEILMFENKIVMHPATYRCMEDKLKAHA